MLRVPKRGWMPPSSNCRPRSPPMRSAVLARPSGPAAKERWSRRMLAFCAVAEITPTLGGGYLDVEKNAGRGPGAAGSSRYADRPSVPTVYRPWGVPVRLHTLMNRRPMPGPRPVSAGRRGGSPAASATAGGPRSAAPARRTPVCPAARSARGRWSRIPVPRRRGPRCCRSSTSRGRAHPAPSRAGRTRRSRPPCTTTRRPAPRRGRYAGSAVASTRPAWSPAAADRCAGPAHAGRSRCRRQTPSGCGRRTRRPRPWSSARPRRRSRSSRPSWYAGPGGAARGRASAWRRTTRRASRRPCRRSARRACSSRRRAPPCRSRDTPGRRCRRSSTSARSGRSGTPARRRRGRETPPTLGGSPGSLRAPSKCRAPWQPPRPATRHPRRSLRSGVCQRALLVGGSVAPMRLGVLDIGSNTGHLLVVDAHGGAAPLPAYSYKEPLRLAEHLDEQGAVGKAGAKALSRFVAQAVVVAEDKGCEEMLGFATSAVRDAVNSDDVLEGVRAETGVDIEVLAGEDEARLTFLAVRRWFGWSAGRLSVFDIGGGSLEIAGGSDESPDVAWSLPLGAARLAREFFAKG